MFVLFDVKRLIGRKFNDPSVQRDKKIWPFEVINENGMPKVRVWYNNKRRTFFPEEISAAVLTTMKTIAETCLGKAVQNAVVTVPAHFNDSQRQATKDAAKIAGLNVLRIINEPTAAALAYGHADKREERQVLVYDLGGGTFDVSLLTIEEGIFEVRSTDGDTHLGGTDFDRRLAEHLAAEFQRLNGINLRNDRRAMCRLQTASERAKRTLSAAIDASIDVVSLHSGIDFHTVVTRARFENICMDLFRKTLGPVRKVLKDVALDAAAVDEIVLVGGSTRIPAIQNLLREVFPRNKFSQTVNPDEAVAVGAAVQAALLEGDQSKTISDLVLVDVTPLSLGINVVGGIHSVIVPRNTTIPTKKSENYTTFHDNQTQVEIEVIEGERKMTKDNYQLGKFTLSGFRKAPRGTPQIFVTYEIDADGILHAQAVEQISNRRRSITITKHKGRLTPKQIEKLIREAEEFKFVDELKKKTAEAKNELEINCYDIKKKANRDRNMSAYNRDRLMDKCDEYLRWLDVADGTKDEYERALHELHLFCGFCNFRDY